MQKLSTRLKDLKASPVRAMLETSMRPEVISFAGGLPSEDSFFKFEPADTLNNAMQYGPSEGERELRELIANELNARNLECDSSQILILSGSQQGIDLVAKMVIDNGTKIAVESPTYLAALQVFRFFGAQFEEIPDEIENIKWSKTNHPPLAYVIPTFQNPTGKCWSKDARASFAEKCEANDVILFEDDPYRDLAYDECERTPVAAFMKNGSWVYQGSFSKILSPGLRIGYIAASKDIFPHLLLLKQAADLHTNRLSQYLVIDYLKSPKRSEHIDNLINNYKQKRDNFALLMKKNLGNMADWNAPKGGLFFWVKLPETTKMISFFEKAKAKNVLFTPGEFFFANPQSAYPSMRLNFSHSSMESADRGITIIGELLRESL
jgi:DNA-binding transcriptional MocR family regulator